MNTDITPWQPMPAAGVLIARIGPFHVGFDLKQVGYLALYAQVLRRPEVSDGFYYGQIRGNRRALPLLGLERTFGLPPAMAEEGNAVTLSLFDETQVALRVDEVIELHAGAVGELQHLPGGLMELEENIFAGWIQFGSISAFLLNLNHLLNDSDIEELSELMF